MFQDRAEAGRKLAERLVAESPVDPVVLALPRGGVPVAIPVAEGLQAPLDLVLVRKIGMPRNPELAAGAVVDGAGHDVIFNDEVLAQSGLTEADFDAEIERKLEQIEERRALYLEGRAPEDISGRTAIVVDDGIATGATARAALKALRRRDPKELWLAVPVAPRETPVRMRGLTDRLIILESPRDFWAVGAHYRVFDQVEDARVVQMMRGAWRAADET